MKTAATKTLAVLCTIAAAALPAQKLVSSTSHSISIYNGSDQRSFVYQRGSQIAVQDGGWSESNWSSDNGNANLERKYAEAHPGTYVVFLKDGILHRLDDAKALARIAALNAPMGALEAQQKALNLQQAPLSAQMKALETQMKATHDPAEQGRIGREMGTIGTEMGDIGRQQGNIGRQQGEIGKTVHDQVLRMMDACLANNSCPAVS